MDIHFGKSGLSSSRPRLRRDPLVRHRGVSNHESTVIRRLKKYKRQLRGSSFGHIPFRTSQHRFAFFLILSLQYSRLSQLGMPPQFWLWVTGRSGCGKTSICEQTLCFLPDTERNAFTIGLTGTCAGISDALDMRYDLPILLDDFSTSEGARQQRAYSDLIDQIMRPSTNGVGRRSQNGVRKAHSLAIVTAEKPLRSYSLASRSLCIFVPTSVDFSLFDVGQGDSGCFQCSLIIF